MLTSIFAALTLLFFPAPRRAAPDDSRWVTIRRVFGQHGEIEDGYFRINLPRTDLHVRIGSDALSPAFEFTSYVGFVPIGTSEVLAMGEVVLRDDEVAAALLEATRRSVEVTAIHNHLLGESPRIVYLHVMAQGSADSVAAHLRAVYATSATPFKETADEKPAADWARIDAILGKHAEAEGLVAEYEFPRHERLTVHGQGVKSSGLLETGSEVVFQRLDASRMANTGELFVLPGEVQGVLRALEQHGLRVTALHQHMVDASPVMYWIHWYATGDGVTMARGVKAALEAMAH